jgi:uncharacterized membrane protein YeaQ/YmgE (transglycosylase-associated protein family)
MGILATLVVGLIAGFIASLIMKTSGGLIMDLVVGVIGGFIGGFASQLLLGENLMSGINLTSILTAAVGAIVLLAIVKLLRR